MLLRHIKAVVLLVFQYHRIQMEKFYHLNQLKIHIPIGTKVIPLYSIFNDSDFEQLDEKGAFRSDDEVGVFFNFMKEIQETINDYRLPEDYGKTTK